MNRSFHVAIATAFFTAALVAAPAQAGKKHKQSGQSQSTFTINAKVVASSPVYETIDQLQPVEECWLEQPGFQQHRHNRQPDRNRSQRLRSDNNSRGNRGRGSSRAGDALIGGVIGGVIGNQLGRNARTDRGRAGATVLGAVVGTVLANEHAGNRERRDQPESLPQLQTAHQYQYQYQEIQPVQRCETRHQQVKKRVLTGWQVTYRYQGRQFTTFMDHKPGKTIPLTVTIQHPR